MPRPDTASSLFLALARGRGEPLFRRISRAIVDEIRKGRLRPGERLSGSRTLAASLGVNRNTVLAAYEELASEGWTQPSRASGTYVSRELPEVKARDFGSREARRIEMPRHPAFELNPAPDPGEPPRAQNVPFSGSTPDLRLTPTAQLARAFRRVLRADPRKVLGYGNLHGHPRLRAALADMLSASRGLAASPDHVLVTSGSQMAIDL